MSTLSPTFPIHHSLEIMQIALPAVISHENHADRTACRHLSRKSGRSLPI